MENVNQLEHHLQYRVRSAVEYLLVTTLEVTGLLRTLLMTV